MLTTVVAGFAKGLRMRWQRLIGHGLGDAYTVVQTKATPAINKSTDIQDVTTTARPIPSLAEELGETGSKGTFG